MNTNNNRSKQVIAIGLEAADPDLLDQWRSEGHLPVIDSLIKKGSWRKLMSNTEISSGATWASLITGVSAAKHGMGFYHRQLKTGSYEIVKKYADEIGRNPFWFQLNKSGKKSVVFDIPTSYPVKDFNGIQIIGWGAEGLNWHQASEPKNIIKEIISKFGKHPLEGWYQKIINNLDEWKKLRNDLLEGVEKRTSIIKWLYEKDQWDFFLVGFAEMHWGGHYFWHLMDEKNPNYNSEFAKECGTTILDIYKAVDKSIAEIIKNSPDATILIFSNTGIGPNYSGQHLIPEILEKLGMSGNGSNGKNHKKVPSFISPAKLWGPYAIKKVETIVSANVIEKVKNIIPERFWDKWTRRFLTLGNNWKTSKAFTVPTDFTGSIRFNLKGREPNGVVDPSEYNSLCEEISYELKALVNPDTGKHPVTEVVRVREKYSGEYLDDLPDLVVKWDGEDPITSLTSPRVGTVSGILPDKRTGAHKTYGFLIANGENIKQNDDTETKDIEDIAPTILYLLGAKIPEDLDGKVLFEIIEENFSENNPVEKVPGKI
jgi:predicted AlkP superfamily phosphohydrolase/phosphomutase